MSFPKKGLLLLFALFFVTLQPLKAQQPQKPKTENYRQAVTLFEKGLYERAAEEFKEFISEHPSHRLTASAAFFYVRTLSQVNPNHKAAYFRRYIQKRPNSVFAQKLLFELANTAKQKGNYQKAVEYYHQVITHNVTNEQKARAYYLMAKASLQMKDSVAARRYFQTIYNKFPESELAADALYAKGRLLLETGLFEEAAATFEILKSQYPDKKVTRGVGTALGEAYFAEGQYRKAIQALRESLRYLDEKQKAKAVLLIAESYNAMGKLDKASTAYRRYINLTKGTPAERAAHYGLGWVYYKRGIYHWAADEFAKAAKGQDLMARKALYYKAVNEKLASRYRQALKTFRKFADKYKSGPWVEKGYYEYAVTAYQMGRYGEAISALLFLIRSDVELKWKGKIYTLLGQAYFANNEYTRALQAYKAAEQVTDMPDEVRRKTLYHKAWLLFSGEAYEQAQPIFEKLYEQAPNTEIGKKALFWSADSYFNMGQFRAAAARFRKFVQKYPNHKLAGAAWYSLGWSYFKAGEYAKAIEPFKQFINHYEPPKIAMFPYDIDAKLRLADAYYALSKYNKAIQAYQKLVGTQPGGDYALFQIANSYYRSERNYRAVTTFRKLIEMYPNSPLREQAQYNIAYIYLNSGNYEQAIAEFRKVISNYPGTNRAALAQFNIGDAYYNAGKYKKAIAAYRKVLRNYPESEYVLEAANAIEYAQAAMSSGAVADTTSALEAFIQNNPGSLNSAQLRYKQAQQMIQTGDYLNAAQKLKKVIKTTENDDLLASAYVSLAHTFYKLNRTAKAIEKYKLVAQRYTDIPQETKAWLGLAHIKFDQGQYAAAADFYRRVIEDSSLRQIEAQTGWGNALLALNKLQAAKKHYQAALNIDNDYASAKIGLARVAIAKNEFSRAVELLTGIASSNTAAAGAEAQYLLGKIQLEKNNFEKAHDAFSKVQVLYKFYDYWVAKSIMGSAKAYIQQGNQRQARVLLQKLVNNYPDTPAADRAKEMLNQ